uniref:Putative ovule protein n=1 Tax=Solanum chacoense TaxID=4108 RepID=A0A0V0HDT8_SOLCH
MGFPCHPKKNKIVMSEITYQVTLSTKTWKDRKKSPYIFASQVSVECVLMTYIQNQTLDDKYTSSNSEILNVSWY